MKPPSRPLTKDEVLDSLHTMMAYGPKHVLIPRVAQEEGPKGEVQVFLQASDGQRWQIDIKKAEPAKYSLSKLRHRREYDDEDDEMDSV